MQNKSQPTTQTQNQNTPKIRFKNFSDEWVDSKLGEICKITMGQSPNGATYSEIPSDYILVQGNADLKNGFVYPRIYTTQKTKMAYIGDLIMSVRAPAGAMGKTLYNVVLGRGIAGIKGNEFIYQNLIKFDMEGYWSSFSAGSTFESLNSNVIFNAKISIPNSEEQEKIGAFFSKLDKLISLHQSKFEKLQKIKKSCLQNLFPQNNQNTPKIRFKNFSDEWNAKILGEICEYKNGKSYEPFICDNGKYNLITLNSVDINGKLKIEHKKILNADEFLIKDDLVIVLSDIAIGSFLGLTAIIPNNNTYVLNQRMGLLRKTINLNAYFLSTLINSKQKYFFSIGQGTSQKNLSKFGVLNLSIKIPKNIKEQEKIGVFFSKLDKLITLHQRKVEKLKNIKKALLNKMFI